MKSFALFTSFFTLQTLVVMGQIQEYKIRPSATEPLLLTMWPNWDTDSHYVYINPAVPKLNKLFIFLPGSFAVPKLYKAITQKAANMGYHSMGLRYPNSWSMVGECANSTDDSCHYKLRQEVFYGKNTSDSVAVDSVNSIKNRLIRLIHYLDSIYPTDGWAQYLDSNNEPVWSKIVMAGHSQGGGYGSLVALNQSLFRVLNFASNDYSSHYNAPANWYYWTKATPPDKFYGMVHLGDDLSLYLEMMDALGVDITRKINVDSSSSPYNNSQILYTNKTPASGTSWGDFHMSVVVDDSSPKDGLGNYLFDPVWEYMLDTNTSVPSAWSLLPENTNTSLTAYPNPFASTTTFAYSVKQRGTISLTIYNFMGQAVRKFIANDLQPGMYSLDWDGTNDEGILQPPGIYYLNLHSNSMEAGTQKIMRIR